MLECLEMTLNRPIKTSRKLKNGILRPYSMEETLAKYPTGYPLYGVI